MKRSMFLLAVMGVSFSIGCCHRHVRAGVQFDPDSLEVRIRQKPSSTDCSVDYEAVNLRKRSERMAGDKIRWCVKQGTSVQYFIHFTDNGGLGSPFAENDFLVNHSPDAAVVCSDFHVARDDKPAREYKYEIHSRDASGPVCNDPKVILK